MDSVYIIHVILIENINEAEYITSFVFLYSLYNNDCDAFAGHDMEAIQKHISSFTLQRIIYVSSSPICFSTDIKLYRTKTYNLDIMKTTEQEQTQKTQTKSKSSNLTILVLLVTLMLEILP